MSDPEDARAQPRRRKAAVAVVCLVLILAGILLRGRRLAAPATPSAHAPRPTSVVAVAARTGSIPVDLDGIGAVQPLATVTIRSRVDGELMRAAYKEGDLVHAGDLIAEIDPRPFEVQKLQAEGQLARDKALLANAKVDLVRYRGLAKLDAAPKQQVDTQEALVRQYEAALVVDQSQIDQAALQITYCHITAPMTGRLGLQLVDPGNMVHASDTGGLVVLTQLQPIAVVFTIPEDALPPLLAKEHAGTPLVVTAWDRTWTTPLATGSFLTLDNAIDPTTGTVKVKAVFPNDDGALFPNQFVNARLELERHDGVTLVPRAAVRRGAQGTYLWVVKSDHTVETRAVSVGTTDADDAAVDGPVAPGDLVVTDGAEGLHAGAPVTLATATS